MVLPSHFPPSGKIKQSNQISIYDIFSSCDSNPIVIQGEIIFFLVTNVKAAAAA